MKRDRKNQRALRKKGWRVFRFWECQIEKDPILIAMRMAKKLRGTTQASVACTIPSRNELVKAAESRVNYTKKQ